MHTAAWIVSNVPPEGLLPARLQMALTLGAHIVLACLGVGLPVLMLVAEGLGIRRADELWLTLARRWSKAFAVLFAVGAVSGTVLSFELGVLWPTFMGRFGGVIGLPFTLEGFAFFLEAIFAGIYLYTWDRLSRWVHFLMGIPVALSGAASAWFVVTANAWMNAPAGFTLDGDTVVDVDPWAAMLGPATGAQTTHMLLAAYLVTGFLVASYYAWRMLRGHKDEYHRRALVLPLVMGMVAAPLQALSGHWAGEVVAHSQPAKLAAMEGQFETERGAPLRLGGWPDVEAGRTRFALELPGLLSFMAYGERSAEVRGWLDFPADERPPIAVVHLAFQAMVAIGSLLIALSAWSAWRLWRGRARGQLRATDALASRAYLAALLLSGPAAVLALEAGWVVTEVGRQPWIVQGIMRTEDAVAPLDGLWWVFSLTMALYAVLLLGAWRVLAFLARKPLAETRHGA